MEIHISSRGPVSSFESLANQTRDALHKVGWTISTVTTSFNFGSGRGCVTFTMERPSQDKAAGTEIEVKNVNHA